MTQLYTSAGSILPVIDIINTYNASGTSTTAPWSEAVSVAREKTLKSDISTLSNMLTQVSSSVSAINDKIGAASGIAQLGSDGKVPASQLPAYVDDVLEGTLTNSTTFTLASGQQGAVKSTSAIYVDTTSNKTYRWSGSAYVEIGSSLALGETSSTAYAGDKGAATTAKVGSLPDQIMDQLTGVTAAASTVDINYDSKYEEDGVYTENSGKVTIPAATTTAAGVMTAADKVKLNGIETGATKTTIDSALSSTSTNPVQNKVINTALAAKANASTTYTKSEVDAKITASGTFDSSQYYTKTDIDKSISTGSVTATGNIGTNSGNLFASGYVSADNLILQDSNDTDVTLDGDTLKALLTIADKIADGYSVVFVKD